MICFANQLTGFYMRTILAFNGLIVNLPVTTNNINATPLDVPEALNSFNNPNITTNAFNIDLDTPIPSRPCPSLLNSDSEKKKILEIEAQLAELKGYLNC